VQVAQQAAWIVRQQSLQHARLQQLTQALHWHSAFAPLALLQTECLCITAITTDHRQPTRIVRPVLAPAVHSFTETQHSALLNLIVQQLHLLHQRHRGPVQHLLPRVVKHQHHSGVDHTQRLTRLFNIVQLVMLWVVVQAEVPQRQRHVAEQHHRAHQVEAQPAWTDAHCSQRLQLNRLVDITQAEVDHQYPSKVCCCDKHRFEAPFRGVRGTVSQRAPVSDDPLACIFCIKVWRRRKCFTSLRYPETLIR